MMLWNRPTMTTCEIRSKPNDERKASKNQMGQKIEFNLRHIFNDFALLKPMAKTHLVDFWRKLFQVVLVVNRRSAVCLVALGTGIFGHL